MCSRAREQNVSTQALNMLYKPMYEQFGLLLASFESDPPAPYFPAIFFRDSKSVRRLPPSHPRRLSGSGLPEGRREGTGSRGRGNRRAQLPGSHVFSAQHHIRGGEHGQMTTREASHRLTTTRSPHPHKRARGTQNSGVTQPDRNAPHGC